MALTASWIACNVRPRQACSLWAGTMNEITVVRTHLTEDRGFTHEEFEAR